MERINMKWFFFPQPKFMQLIQFIEKCERNTLNPVNSVEGVNVTIIYMRR